MKRLKKVLSLLLACCMLLGMLPASALAAELDAQQEEARQFALYMSELGLVDESGQLIQDNTFTVEDGTHLNSLDELLDWLGECEEADMGTLITVDATGRVATADLLLQAISVESQVGLLSNMLNLLAEGSTAVDTSAHSLCLVQKITNDSENKDILILRVGVSTTENGEFVAAPNDIKIQSGLFVNYLEYNYTLDVDNEPLHLTVAGYGSPDTLTAGETYIEYKLDLSKVRYYYNRLDSSATPWNTSGHIDGENGHWSGCEIALLQSRVVSGAPEQSVQSYFYFSPFEGSSPLYKSANGDLYNVGVGDASSGGLSKPMVYTFTNTNTTYISGTDHFTFKPQAAHLVKRNEEGSFPLTSVFEGAWYLGVGDKDHSIIIEDAYALLKVDNTQNLNNSNYGYGIVSATNPNDPTDIKIDLFDFNLYRYDSNNVNNPLTKIADGTPLYLYTGGKDLKAKEIAYTVSGSWPIVSVGSDVQTLYNQLMAEANVDDCLTNSTSLDSRRIGLYFSDLKLSSSDYSEDGFNINLPMLAFRTNELKTPLTFATGGKVKLADTTKPTVKNVSFPFWEKSFRPGDVIPIVVEFSEPVYGDYTLEYECNNEKKTLSSVSSTSLNNYGTVGTFDGYSSGSSRSNDAILSNRRVFYYTVQPGDTGIKVTGVSECAKTKAYEYNARDIFDNTFESVTFEKAYTIDGIIRAASVKDTISSLSATVNELAPTEMTVTLNLKDNALTQTLWGNWNAPAQDTDQAAEGADQAAESTKPFTVSVILNGDTTNKYSEAVLQQNGKSVAYTIPLPALETGTRDYTVELYVEEASSNTDGKYYGACATCTQKAIVKADASAFTISVGADGWPSGTDNTVYVQDQKLPVFSAKAGTKTDYTFKGTDQFYWESSAPDVLDISLNGTENTLQDSPTVSITPLKEGTATLTLRSKNGSTDKTWFTQASNEIKITVKDDNRPTLLLADNANTFFARQDIDLTFSFTSNLGEKYSNGDDSPITVTLYENGGTTPLWTDTLARDKTEVTIPGTYLTKISTGDTPGYHVTLTATATYENESTPRRLSTDAYIVVRSQPARVTLPWTTAPLLTSDQTLNITWTTENWDTTNLSTCGFDFRVEKNGEIYGNSHITDVDQAASGSYTLIPDTPTGLKDEYVVLVKAKNASDPTWSSASAIITVYRSGALDLVVGGEKADELTLKNSVTQTTTSTAPTITSYEGQTFTGLTNASAIAALRGQLSLMESISINYEDYDWNYVNDMFQWSTTESAKNANISETAEKLQEIVSINYRQGGYYEPLENFSYLYYIPRALMLLCGLSNGSTTVTAQHASLPSLSSSVTVNVELLKNKLYLFQFTPAVKTTVSYEDGKGITHTVTSNSDGSLALYEPDGIASDLRCASESGGQIYRGTASMLGDTYNVNLKSGEGNGIYDELYPLNAVELRPAASVELTILKPDGSPLSNANVTLRGGVYRNVDQVKDASQRDTAYCPTAKFSKTSGGTASLDGKVDQVFTTDANGVLRVYMDSTQFVSQREPGSALDQDDTFRFVFELRFADNAYQPELVEIDTGMTQSDVIRSGGNLLTLIAASGVKPVVASQTVDYYTGREIDVRRHTGVVGPSADYTTVRLSTRLLLWGMGQVSTQDTGYSFDVRTQETAVKLSGQTHTNASTASYPFSSIPVLENVTIINTDSFGDFKATKRLPLELVIYNGSGSMERTQTLPFGLIDMTAVEKVSTSQSVIGLMTRLTAEGSNVLPNLNDNKVMKVADDLLDVIGLLEGVGAKLGFIRTVLMPTEDPTIYSAYVWMGYDTTTMTDLRYDDNGIYLEPAHLVQDLEQVSFAGFTIGDYKAMSDGTYFERLQEDNSALASRIFGEGNVMQGWMSAEICYNFNEGRWQVITTGGAMTYGKQFEKPIQKQRFKPIVYNYGVVLRGGVVVTLETAIRYAEALGNGQGTPEMLQAINDYLTSIRVNAFIELYGGIGIDKYGVAFTIGAYGDVELNTETRILKRGDESGKKTYGDFIQLDGKIGLREKVGVGSLVLQFDLVSISVGDQWKVRNWDEVTTSWANNQSGYSTGWIDGKNTQTSSYSVQSSGRQVVVATSSGEVRVQSRDYLQEGERSWLGGGGTATLALQTGEDNRLAAIQTNSYPFSTPMISDDGGLLVYLSDADSSNVEDVEVRFSKNDGGTFLDGTAIPSPTSPTSPTSFTSFTGYGDSDLELDGDMDHAAAIWLRQSAHLDLSPGATVTQEQQLALTNGLEVVTSIWNGSNWASTRLTENGTQELTPIIAINSDGSKAVAAWRSVQQGDSLLSFTENRVLFKLYDSANGWSEQTYTLYNGSAGSVSSMSIEMIDDTALVAYTVEDTTDNTADSEIYYALVDTTANSVEDTVKTVRVTTNDYTDADPKLTTAGNLFVLGWYREPDDASDIGLLTIDTNGAPRSDLPASLSDVVSTESFNGKFAFVKGANSLDDLSLLWDDYKSGDADNDVIRAIKFSNFGTVAAPSYGTSAAVEVAALPANTQLDSIDAYTEYGTDVQAVLQATTYSTVDKEDSSTYETVTLTVSASGETATARVPKETVNLYSALETYTDKVEVVGTNVDFSTLAVNSYIPVTFTVSNQGIHAIHSISVTLGGTTQTFSGLNLLPGQNKTLSAVVKTDSVIEDLTYTVEASFSGTTEKQSATGTVYLDYPDVGISTLTVTSEENGHRTFLATLYDQSAAALNKSDRRVVLGVYTDPSCTTRINGKYFKDGTANTGYEIVIDSSDDLSKIDNAGFAKELDFDIASYMKDAGMTEIPDSGVTLFVRARVERQVDGKWAELPEADTQNNQKSITFHSLLERSGNASVTTSVELTNASGASTATVQLRSHTLQPIGSDGYLLAALLDSRGQLLETQNIGNVSLACEEVKTQTVTFSRSGSRVVLRYGEPAANVSDASANVTALTIDGLPLTLDSFDQNGVAELYNVADGSYLLSVLTESPSATVTVNGKTAENGMAELTAGGTYTIVVTSGDGSASTTYVVRLYAVTPDIIWNTLRFETNGGSTLSSVTKVAGSTVELSAYRPTREGYTFAGWYADPELTQSVTKVQLTRDTTVYAAWTEGEPENPFTDVTENDWFYSDVLYVYANGLMNGTSTTTFSPTLQTTRGMIVTILYRLSGSPQTTGTCPFPDVPAGSYYENAIIWAHQNGIVTGYDNGCFGPDDNITREQLATILYRYAQYTGLDVSVGEDTNILSYSDAQKISEYAIPAMQWACGTGLIQGTTDSTLSPAGLATRAQAAAILHRFRESTATE